MTKRRRILLVEDEYLIAHDLAHDLRALGAEVVGPIPSLEKGLNALEAEPCLDGAVLDINLNGEMVFPLVDALRQRKVPILFTTGYDEGVIPARYAEIARCEKPVTPIRFKQAVVMALRLEN